MAQNSYIIILVGTHNIHNLKDFYGTNEIEILQRQPLAGDVSLVAVQTKDALEKIRQRAVDDEGHSIRLMYGLRRVNKWSRLATHLWAEYYRCWTPLPLPTRPTTAR